MNSSLLTSDPSDILEGIGGDTLSVALIGPKEPLRDAIALALGKADTGPIATFPYYPAIDEAQSLLEQHFDAIFIDLDNDPIQALKLIEALCTRASETVIAYSTDLDSERMMRCMRAGAREYLTEPFSSAVMADALVRIRSRRKLSDVVKKAPGKLFSFLGSKGGLGVTTIAVNFAISLAGDPKCKTLLIDLNFPLGDAALNLGINAQYSTIDAFQDVMRLDSHFLSNLVTKHSSGLFVLAAPSYFTGSEPSNEAIDRLLSVARQEFDYLVIDLGTRSNLHRTMLFADTSTIYLVTQAGVPELRNANRLLSEFFTTDGPKVEIVVNRSTSRTFGIDESHIEKALMRPVQWKIPGDYITAKKNQNAATPVVLNDSPISRAIRQMAEAASTKSVKTEKKKLFGGLFSSKS